MAELSSDADLTVHVERLRALAGDLRRAAAGLDVALAVLGGGSPGDGGVEGIRGDPAALGSGTLGEALGHYVEACRHGLRELRDNVADAAGGLDATAADYAEHERRVCASFHRLGAAMSDPVVERSPR
jgi:hypothetical protein